MFPRTSEYPKEIFVKDMVWRVRFCRTVPDDPQEKDLGMCDPESRTIFIRYKQKPRETFMTFVHELLHAFEFEYNIEISHEIIYELEECIADLVTQNPELFILFMFRVFNAS